MLIDAVYLITGLIILFLGGHYLVRGAVVIALLARVSTTLVALTVVSMGTSMPELAVSLDAALRGSTDISYGNIIGSNIFNVGAILSAAALMSLIPVRQQTLRLEYPIMFVVSCIVLLLARDGVVDRLEGAFLVTTLVVFIAYMVYLARRGVETAEAERLKREVERTAHVEAGTARAWGVNGALVVGSIFALAAGAHLTVAGAVGAAGALGVEERVIGLTVIAMGTSLPELATSIMAARQGEQDIALGNVVGSNIFNLLAILGITAAFVPVPVHPRAASVDNWVMLGFSAVLLPIMLRGRNVTRWNGAFLLAAFFTYMGYVVVVR